MKSRNKKQELYQQGLYAMLNGAIRATAADFAFSDKEEYVKRSVGQRYGATPILGALGGALGGKNKGSSEIHEIKGKAWRHLAGGGALLGAYGIEYLGVSFSKGYHQRLYTGGWEKKAAVSGYKALLYSLILY